MTRLASAIRAGADIRRRSATAATYRSAGWKPALAGGGANSIARGGASAG
jgi:hypothetical protein